MDRKKLPDIQFRLISITLGWPDVNPNNQVRTKIMESTLFTALSTNEEANLSGGTKPVKIIKGGNATGGNGTGGNGTGGAGGAGTGGVVFVKKINKSTVSADGIGGNGGAGTGGAGTGGAALGGPGLVVIDA